MSRRPPTVSEGTSVKYTELIRNGIENKGCCRTWEAKFAFPFLNKYRSWFMIYERNVKVTNQTFCCYPNRNPDWKSQRIFFLVIYVPKFDSWQSFLTHNLANNGFWKGLKSLFSLHFHRKIYTPDARAKSLF